MTEQHPVVQGSLSENGFHVHIIKTVTGVRKYYAGTHKTNTKDSKIKTGGIPLLTRHI